MSVDGGGRSGGEETAPDRRLEPAGLFPSAVRPTVLRALWLLLLVLLLALVALVGEYWSVSGVPAL